MKDLLLSREELDYMEDNPIFTLWLFGKDGLIDERNLSEEDKAVIKARQMYYDLILPDNYVKDILNHLNCTNYDQLLESSEQLASAARFLSVRKDILVTKLTLMKKREEQEIEKKEYEDSLLRTKKITKYKFK